MKSIKLNMDNIDDKVVDKINNKVRVILVDDNNNVVVTKYADIFMLPGGKINKGESLEKGLVREVKEELGIDLSSDNFIPFIEISTFIEDYPVVGNSKKENRINNTTYYLVRTNKKYNKDNISLSDREKENGFEVRTLNIIELLKLIISYHSDNERYVYFKYELLHVIDELNKYLNKEKAVRYNKYINSYKNSDKSVDMHIHSMYSDGELSPDELVELAFNYNIGTMAITDHDTINGIKNLNRNSSLIFDSGINVIDGIELSAKVDKGIMHILGYGIDKDNDLLNRRLNKIRDINVNTVLSIIEILKNDYNIYFSYDDLRNLINSNHNLGRPDVARLLMKNGYVKTVPEAFDRYLISAREKLGKRLKGLPYEECIDLIIKSGGIPVLAHPKTLKLDNNDLRELIKYMKSIGLSGVEVYHSIHSKEERNEFLNIANDYDLLISGGTDYHGPVNKPYIKLGSGENNNVKIRKLSLVDELNRKMQL